MRGGIREIPSAPERSAVAALEAAGWRVRVPFRGRTYHHANRDVLVDGNPLPIRLSRSRAREAVSVR
jgi:hypothetical protein